MPGVVQRRKAVSFIVQFGPPTAVWIIGVYLLYRATQLDGVVSDRTFAIGLLLVVCGTIIGSSRRSRQTTTRERALELQIQRMNQRMRLVEQKVDQVVMDVHTENAARAIREAAESGHNCGPGKRSMRLVSKENGTEN
jgi:hypothetical protein